MSSAISSDPSGANTAALLPQDASTAAQDSLKFTQFPNALLTKFMERFATALDTSPHLRAPDDTLDPAITEAFALLREEIARPPSINKLAHYLDQISGMNTDQLRLYFFSIWLRRLPTDNEIPLLASIMNVSNPNAARNVNENLAEETGGKDELPHSEQYMYGIQTMDGAFQRFLMSYVPWREVSKTGLGLNATVFQMAFHMLRISATRKIMFDAADPKKDFATFERELVKEMVFVPGITFPDPTMLRAGQPFESFQTALGIYKSADPACVDYCLWMLGAKQVQNVFSAAESTERMARFAAREIESADGVSFIGIFSKTVSKFDKGGYFTTEESRIVRKWADAHHDDDVGKTLGRDAATETEHALDATRDSMDQIEALAHIPGCKDSILDVIDQVRISVEKRRAYETVVADQIARAGGYCIQFDKPVPHKPDRVFNLICNLLKIPSYNIGGGGFC